MRTYFYSLLVLGVLFLGQIAGNDYGLYLHIWTFDIAMHFLGGLGIGLAVLASVRLHTQHIYSETKIILSAVLIAGILWELFEAYYNIAGTSPGIDPRFTQMFSRNKISGKYLEVNPNLMEALQKENLWEKTYSLLSTLYWVRS